MSKRTDSGTGEIAQQAFRKLGWRALLPRLLAAAAGCLQRFGLCASAPEAQDLVNETVCAFLSGKREWKLGVEPSDRAFMAYFCQTMESIAEHRRRRTRIERSDGGEAGVLAFDRTPSAERQLIAGGELARVEDALQGDAEAQALHEAECAGCEGRDELAEELGWSTQRVKVVRWRRTKLISSLRSTPNEDEESGPPSARPPWSQDEPQQHPGEGRRKDARPVRREPVAPPVPGADRSRDRGDRDRSGAGRGRFRRLDT